MRVNIKANIEKKFWFPHICFQCTLSLPPENVRKPAGFMTFSGGRERLHWERTGLR